MNDILILADIHLGHKNFSKHVFHKDIEYFEEIVFPYILENNIKNVILCGDLIHNRDLSSNYIVQASKERFFGWFEKNCINFHILIGNHDLLYKNRVDYNWPKTNLKEFEYITVYEESTIVNIEGYRFGFLPWQVSKVDIPSIIPPKNIDILVAHLDVNNALMQGNTKSFNGLDVSLFKDYKQVITGHYHATSDFHNVKYIGAPYQMSYRDYNNKKGFWVLGSDMQFEYHENSYSPKYLKLYYIEENRDFKLFIGGVEEDKIEVSVDEAIEYISNNYFKFIVKDFKNEKLLQEAFIKITETSYDKIDLINEVSSIADFDIASFEHEMDESVELIDIFESYVESITFRDKRISKKKVIEDLKSYYEQTKIGGDEE